MLASDNTKSSVFVCKYNTRSSQSANVDAKKRNKQILTNQLQSSYSFDRNLKSFVSLFISFFDKVKQAI